MFENVPLFEHMHLKYAKSANMIQNNIFFLHTFYKGVSKNAEFYSDSKLIDMGSTKY
jgi:hypothetical protein